MGKVNKHGLKMKNLKKAASATKGLEGWASPWYIQLSYDTEDGGIITTPHYDLGQWEYAQFHSPTIVDIANISDPMTMQEIANMIYNDISERGCAERL